MKKVELNIYKKLKRVRNDLFNEFRKQVSLSVDLNEYKWVNPTFVLRFGLIAKFAWIDYKTPQIQTPQLNKMLDRIKDLSIDIENIHPKTNRQKYEEERIDLERSLETLDLMILNKVPERKVCAVLKNLKDNKLLREVFIKSECRLSIFEYYIILQRYLEHKPFNSKMLFESGELLMFMKNYIDILNREKKEVKSLITNETNTKIINFLNNLDRRD